MAALRLFPVLMLIPIGLACSGVKKAEKPKDNQTAQQFCESFGKAACNETVVTNCSGGGTNVDNCVASQAAFCLSILEAPSFYSSENSKACLEAVAAAYQDAQLTAAEVHIVRELGAPCDKLIKGPGEAGSSCSRNADCNTLVGLTCLIAPGAVTGSCEIPELVSGGMSCAALNQVCVESMYCKDGNCVQRPPNAQGYGCAPEIPCSPDYICIDTGPDAGANQLCSAGASSCTCTTKTATGGACTTSAQCQSGVCAGNLCQELIKLFAESAYCSSLR